MANHLEYVLLGMTMIIWSLKEFFGAGSDMRESEEQLKNYQVTLGEHSLVCKGLEQALRSQKRIRRNCLIFTIWGIAIVLLTMLNFFGLL